MGVFADSVGVDPYGVGQSDAAALQLGQRKLVVADADGLNPSQSSGALEQIVTPGTGNHQHVDLGHARLDCVGAVFLKHHCDGKAMAEFRGDLIGRMTDPDGQVLGGQLGGMTASCERA